MLPTGLPKGLPRKADLGGGLAAARTRLGMVAVAVVTAVALAAVGAALPAPKRPAAAARGEPYSARWVCPLLPRQDGTITVTNTGTGQLRVHQAITLAGQEGQAVPGPPLGDATLEPGNRYTIRTNPGKVTAPGVLQVEGIGGAVAVAASGHPPCSASPSDRWWLAEMDTQADDARIIVANPYDESATVQIRLHTSGGQVTPPNWQSLFIPGRSAIVRSLRETSMPGLRMWVEVAALSGRVVAGGEVTRDRERLLVPGQTTSRPAWWFASGLGGSSGTSELLLTNPNPGRNLTVDVQLLTARGVVAPKELQGLVVEPGRGAHRDVPLSGEQAIPFALRVRSRDGLPFMAALLVRPGGQLGQAAPAPFIDTGTGGQEQRWLVPPPPAGLGAKQAQLVLANFAPEPVTVRVVPQGADPGSAASVEVPPGQLVLAPAAGEQPRGAQVGQQKGGAAPQGLVLESDRGFMAGTLWGQPAVPATVIGGLDSGPVVLRGSAAAP